MFYSIALIALSILHGCSLSLSLSLSAQLISTFFTTWIVYLYRKFQATLAFFLDCTGRYMLDLVGNPPDRFSRIGSYAFYQRVYKTVHLTSLFWATSECSSSSLLASASRTKTEHPSIRWIYEINKHMQQFYKKLIQYSIQPKWLIRNWLLKESGTFCKINLFC